MKLEPHEKQNPLWLKLKKMFEEDLDQLRKRNDAVTLTPEQTAAIRGEIARVKKYLEMDKEMPVVK